MVKHDVIVKIGVTIPAQELEITTSRAGGPGGQHVNKTSSAIRLTHFPTGIVVQCQSERSQHKNRATAIKMLRARIARMDEEKREAEQLAATSSNQRLVSAHRFVIIFSILISE